MKTGDYVYYKDGQLATVDFVFQDEKALIKIIALTILDTGDELMCEEDEVTPANIEITELLYEQDNKVSEGPLDKT